MTDDLGFSLGPLEVGIVVSIYLFGIVTTQAYCYYETFPRDGRLLKAVVALLWVLCLSDAVCSSMAIYSLTIEDFGQLQKLERYPRSFILTIVFSGCTAVIVQVFLAHRVLQFSGRTMVGTAVAATCWCLSMLLVAFSILAAVGAFRALTITTFGTDWGWIVMTGLSIAAAVDVLITASLCYYLSQKKVGAMKTTAKLLDKLIMWTLQTGLLTSISAIVTVICFKAMTNNSIWVAMFTFATRLYANSFLSLLNGRHKLQNTADYISDESGRRFSRSAQFAPPIAVDVSVEMSQRFDTEASPSSAQSHVKLDSSHEYDDLATPPTKSRVLSDDRSDSPTFRKSQDNAL